VYAVLLTVDEFVQHPPHWTRVAAHECVRGRDVTLGVEPLPVQHEPGVCGELLEEGALRPTVALAERVDGVDLAQVLQ
jgi:hypothetical protein